MPLIDYKEVHRIAADCLYREDELPPDSSVPEGAVLVEGIVHKMGYHPERLAGHAQEIRDLLDNLPDAFAKDGGGGWSFLNMPTDKNGELWGEQITAESLLCLGIGIGYARILLPREVWPVLPGGVPYIQTGEEAQDTPPCGPPSNSSVMSHT